MDNPLFKLSLLISDGRRDLPRAFLGRIRHVFITKEKFFGRILLKFQMWIERKFFFKESFTVDRDLIIDNLNKVDLIKVKPKKKKFLDIFDKKDVERIISYKVRCYYKDMNLVL